MATPLERARLSLEGLSLGDAFGERFFTTPEVAEDWILTRQAPPGPMRWTDDTAMAISVVEVLEAHGEIDEDALAMAFARRYALEPFRGYGGGAHRVLQDIVAGKPWADAAGELYAGEGSLGNGGAMRAAPVGAWFAADAARVAKEALRSARPTHAHAEGQAGAVAVALAAAFAAVEGPGGGAGLLEAAIAGTPESDVRAGLRTARELPPSYSSVTAASVLGSGRRISAPDTVPYSLWCAARHLGDYVEALWTTVAGEGDRDTTCAIVGGIVALAAGHAALPADWIARREPLPRAP